MRRKFSGKSDRGICVRLDGADPLMRPTGFLLEPQHPRIPRHTLRSAITRSKPPASVGTVFQRARECLSSSTLQRPCEYHLVGTGARLRLLCQAAAGRAAAMRPGPKRPGDILNNVPRLTSSLRFNQAGDEIPGFQARRRSWARACADFGGQQCTSPCQEGHGPLRAWTDCGHGRVTGSRSRVPPTITPPELAYNTEEHG